jgi:hypothetical protein
LRSLLAILLVLPVLGGLVFVRTVSIDRNSPTPTAPTPTVHTIKQLLLPGLVPFQTFWNEIGQTNAGVKAINDAETWSALWHDQTLCNISDTCSNLPEVDFNYRTVIVVAEGQQGSLSYHINVMSGIASHDYVSLDATLTTPGLYCKWIQAITFPTQVIEIHQTNLPLIFNMTEEQAPACPH